MAQTYQMSATARDKGGKGAARAARRAEQVPAVIYGDKKAPVMINLDLRELRRHLATTFYTHVYDLKVGNETHHVIPRDVQFHPVSESPLHVDFLRVSDRTKITVMVPIEAVGMEKSPGIKNGGLLNLVFHELEVKCSANQIPEHVTVDVSTMEIGDVVHLNEIKLPTGVEPIFTDRNATIVSINAPNVHAVVETAAPAPVEVAAIKQKAPEPGAAPAGNVKGPAPKKK